MKGENQSDGFYRRAPRPRGPGGVTVLLLSILSLQAQETGTVRGRVTDKDGSPLPGAVVTLRSDKVPSARNMGAVTDARGEFRILSLSPADDYQVSASFPGKTTVIQGPIHV